MADDAKPCFEPVTFDDLLLSVDPAPSRKSLRLFVERARALGTNPFPDQASTVVRCRGQRLSYPIYWRGRQWAVTRYGVECRDGFYCIEISRIWEDEFNSQLYGWVEHMACTKDWVDVGDFVEALRLARSLAWVQHQNQSLTRPFFPWKNLPVCPVEITRRGDRS